MKVLEVENLIRNYRRSSLKKSEEDVKVLKGLNFAVEEGEFVGIMGKSGCGKTTLLKVLGMIDKQTGGTVRFMGEDVSEIYGDRLADVRRKQIGFIFQDFYLMDSLSVEENIMLPMILGREKESVMTKAAQEYAEKFLISHLVKKILTNYPAVRNSVWQSAGRSLTIRIWCLRMSRRGIWIPSRVRS